MSKIKPKRIFFDLFNTDNLILKVKFNAHSDVTPTEIQIENTLSKKAAAKNLIELTKICTDVRLKLYIEAKTNG